MINIKFGETKTSLKKKPPKFIFINVMHKKAFSGVCVCKYKYINQNILL